MNEEDDTIGGAELIAEIVNRTDRRRAEVLDAEESRDASKAERLRTQVQYLQRILNDLAEGKKKKLETLRAAAWRGCSPQELRDRARYWSKVWLDGLFRGRHSKQRNEVVQETSIEDPDGKPVASLFISSGDSKGQMTRFLGEDVAEELLAACQAVHLVETGRYVSLAAFPDNLFDLVASVDASFDQEANDGRLGGDDRARKLSNALVNEFSKRDSMEKQLKK